MDAFLAPKTGATIAAPEERSSDEIVRIEEDDDGQDNNTSPAEKPPSGNDVSIRMFSFCDIPATFDKGTYHDYLWPLNEKGKERVVDMVRAHNAKYGSRRVKLDPAKGAKMFTHFCVACFEEGEIFVQCLLNYEGSNKGNRSKHHATHTKGRADWDGFIFNKIAEYRGNRCGRAKPVKVLANDGSVVAPFTESTKQEIVRVATKLIAAAGLPFHLVEHPYFRELLDLARRSPNGENLIIGPQAIRRELLKISFDVTSQHAAFLRTLKHRAFVIFDGWDGKQKIIGFSLVYIKESPRLELINYPMSFAYAKLDTTTNQMAGAGEIIRLLREVLSDKGLSLDIIAGAKSDNAMLKAIATLNQNGLNYYSPDPYDWDDTSEDGKIGCISHLLNLAVIYAIGEKVAKKDGEGAIPPGPSNDDVQNAIRAAHDAMEWLSNEKNWQKAESKARELNLELLQPCLPNVTRWNSQLSMISRAIDDFEVLSHFTDEKKHAKVLTKSIVRILAQFEGILEPLTMLQKLTQTTEKPFGPATLPGIAMILRRYGITCESLLRKHAEQDVNLTSKLQFLVRDPDEGIIRVKYHDLSSEARSLIDSIQRHLLFRLVKQRNNRLFFEVVGMFLDPVMKTFARKVCGKGDLEWSYDDVKRRVDAAVKKLISTREPVTQESAILSSSAQAARVLPCAMDCERYDTDDDDDTLDIQHTVSSEFEKFLGDVHPIVAKVPRESLLTFSTFVTLFKEHDPIEYWSDFVKQREYQTIFGMNLVALAYPSSSAYQESLFSTSGMTLSDVRNRLYDNPIIAEGVVTLRHSLSREIARKSRFACDRNDSKRHRLQDPSQHNSDLPEGVQTHD